MSLLITNATILTVDAGDRVIHDGAVYVEDFELKTADARALIDDAGAAADAAWGQFVAKYGDIIAR